MKYKTLLLLFLGIGVLAVMIIIIGPAKVEESFKFANPLYIVLAFILQITIYLLLTERWSITIRPLGISVKKLHLLPMLLVGLAVNNITPSGRGGGEPIRAYILSKYSNSPMESSFATVIADRGLDTLPFFLLAVLTLIYAVLFLKLSFGMMVLLLISLMLLLIVFILILYTSLNQRMGKKITLRLVRLVKKLSRKKHNRLEERALDALNGFQKSIRILIKNRTVLIYGLPISFLIWLMEILRIYIVFSAFDVPISLELVAAVFIISTLVGIIPLLPGGLGTVDGIMIVLYSVAGIPPSISAAATILERLISFWMTSLLGIAMLPYFGREVMEKLEKRL